MRSKTFPLLIIVLLGLMSPSTANSQPPMLDCSDFMLAADQGEPFRNIGLLNLPEPYIEYYAEFTDGGNTAPAIFRLDANDNPVMVLPPHPSYPFQGGAMSLRVLDDDDNQVCPKHTVHVDPLEDTPGAFAEYVDELGQLLAQQREMAGVTAADLHAGEDIDSIYMLQLAQAQALYNAPDNPNALVNIVKGTAPILDTPAFDQRLLDAVTAQSRLTEAARTTEDWVTAKRFSRAPGLAAPARQDTPYIPFAETEKREINYPQDLQQAFHDQYDAQDIADAQDGLNNSALTATLIGFYNPVAGTIIGATIHIYRVPREANMFLLPSQYDSLWFSIDGERMPELVVPEDDERDSFLHSVYVQVSSKEWVVNTVITDSKLLVIGGLGLGGSAAKASARVSQQAKRVIDGLDEAVSAPATVAELGNNYCGRYVDSCVGDEREVVIGPYEWTVRLDYDGQLNTFWDLVITDFPDARTPVLQTAPDDQRFFRARNAGKTIIYVESEEILHPTGSITGESVVYTVQTTDVQFDRTGVTIEEFEEFCVGTVIDNVQDTGVRWSVVESYVPMADPVPASASETPADTCITAPAFPEDAIEYNDWFICGLTPVVFPLSIVLRADSTADRGPRKPEWSPPPRYDELIISVEPSEEKLVANPPPPPPSDLECEEPEAEPTPVVPNNVVNPGTYRYVTLDACDDTQINQGEIVINSLVDMNTYYEYFIPKVRQTAPNVHRIDFYRYDESNQLQHQGLAIRLEQTAPGSLIEQTFTGYVVSDQDDLPLERCEWITLRHYERDNPLLPDDLEANLPDELDLDDPILNFEDDPFLGQDTNE